jgi:hypothetical protein
VINKIKSASIAILGASLLFTPVSVSAAPINATALVNSSGSDQVSPLTEVRYRGRHWRGHRWSHRHHHHGNGGAVAAGAIIGLAAGAIAANAAASNNAVAYCSQRFRSYDPASGTYMGYDGYRHPCP